MVISHKYEFIFIKAYKTAGTSIEVFLSQHGGKEDIFTPVRPPVPPHRAKNHRGFWDIRPDLRDALCQGWGAPRNLLGVLRRFIQRMKFRPHMPGSLIKRRIPAHIWDRYFKFCVERNPWDKTLSHFYMLKSRSNGSLTLDEYFEQGNFCLNYPLYTENDNVIVDKVLKYESLQKELGQVFGYLGVPYDGKLGVHAKSGHRKKESYRDILNEYQKRIIENKFQNEIDLHGYAY